MVWVNTSPLVKTYTLEEFWELPEPPDHLKVELIAGVLYLTPPPDYMHDYAVSRINRLLSIHLAKTDDKGRLLVPRAAIWSSPNTHLEPDLFYLAEETERRLEPSHRITADLVIEVISPGSAIYDRNTKADTYATLGVKELWLVDEVSQTIEIRSLAGQRFGAGVIFAAEQPLVSTVLPGLTFGVARIFTE